jgi:phytoene/squalene synthetase
MSKRGDARDGDPQAGPTEHRPRSVVSLLGQKADPREAPPPGRREGGVEGDLENRPGRADASGGNPLSSAHSTFHHMEAPRDDFDPVKAREVCAQVARDILRDFAPGLVLLPAQTRERAQAFIAYARTLLDFARDRSLEGERLAQINRFEFELESALNGEPPGQPVFVQLATIERGAPWPRESFDELAKVARSRVTIGRPRNQRAAAEQWRRLARAGLLAILGEPPAPAVEAAAATVLRAASLFSWHDALCFDRPDLGLTMDDAPSPRFDEAVGAEERAIAAELDGAGAAIAELPKRLRPAARYALLAAAELARRAKAEPRRSSPPSLSVARRLAIVLRARIGS